MVTRQHADTLAVQHDNVSTPWRTELLLAASNEAMQAMLARKVTHHLLKQGLDRPPVDRCEDVKLALGVGREIAAELDLADPRGRLRDSLPLHRVRCGQRRSFADRRWRGMTHGQAGTSCHHATP